MAPITSPEKSQIKAAYEAYAAAGSTADVAIEKGGFGSAYESAHNTIQKIAGLSKDELTGKLAGDFQAMLRKADSTDALRQTLETLKEHGINGSGTDRIIKANLRDLQRDANKLARVASDAIKKHAEAIGKLSKGGEKLGKVLTEYQTEQLKILEAKVAEKQAGLEAAEAILANAGAEATAAEKTAVTTAKTGFETAQKNSTEFAEKFSEFYSKMMEKITTQHEYHTKSLEEIKTFIGKLEDNGIKIDTNIKRDMLIGGEKSIARTADEAAVQTAEHAAPAAHGGSALWPVLIGAGVGGFIGNQMRGDDEGHTKTGIGAFIGGVAGYGAKVFMGGMASGKAALERFPAALEQSAGHVRLH